MAKLPSHRLAIPPLGRKTPMLVGACLFARVLGARLESSIDFETEFDFETRLANAVVSRLAAAVREAQEEVNIKN
eukprot:gene16084-22226_t